MEFFRGMQNVESRRSQPVDQIALLQSTRGNSLLPKTRLEQPINRAVGPGLRGLIGLPHWISGKDVHEPAHMVLIRMGVQYSIHLLNTLVAKVGDQRQIT